MAQVLTNLGEEFMQKNSFRQDLITRDSPEQIEVLVFDQSTDSLGDANDVGDITTEPSDGNYARKTFDLDSSTNISIIKSGGDYVMDIADHQFDMTNTTGTVDHYAIVATFQADETSDSSQNKHLIAFGPLEQSYDLSNVDTLENKNAGISLN